MVITLLNALIQNQLSILKSRSIEAVVLNTVKRHNIVSVDDVDEDDDDDDEEYMDSPKKIEIQTYHLLIIPRIRTLQAEILN